MRIHEYLSRNAQDFSDKPAIIQGDTTLTWSELSAKVDACAAAIAPSLSAEEQEVVGILLANSWQFIVVYLAVLKTGHIALPLDPNYKKLEIDNILEQITPKLNITDPSRAQYFAASTATPMMADDLADAPLVEPGAGDYLELPETEQIASLLFTSGTTGKPKITQYSHSNHMWNITAVSDLWEWTADDTMLLSLPLSHWHGLIMGVDGALYHGNTIYLHERFEVEPTLEMLASGKISLFMHVPIAYSRLVGFENPDKYDITGVRLCVSGSSYLPPAVWNEFNDKYHQQILERYGASEMGLLTSNPLDDRQPGSVGKPLRDVTIRVTESGELAMKSPGLFPGYYKNPEATAKNYTEDGMWMTGDIGDLAEDGRLRLKGRVIEKLKKLGYTVYPRDVEWAMQQNPAVREMALLGLQDEKNLSDTFVYFVVGKLDEQEVRDFAKANLPAAWRPDIVVFLDELPKTRSGKPVRAELMAMAEAAAKA